MVLAVPSPLNVITNTGAPTVLKMHGLSKIGYLKCLSIIADISGVMSIPSLLDMWYAPVIVYECSTVLWCLNSTPRLNLPLAPIMNGVIVQDGDKILSENLLISVRSRDKSSCTFIEVNMSIL